MRSVKKRYSMKSLTGALVSAGAITAIPPVASAATIAFYAPWDAQADSALQRHADQIDILAPAWITVTGSNDRVRMTDATGSPASLGKLQRVRTVLPLVQNDVEGVWRGADSAVMLASPARRKILLGALEADIVARKGSGMIFDLEELPSSAQTDYVRLLAEARARFAARHWKIGVCIPADSPEWNLAVYGQAADLVILMAYDEHWQTGAPGPIASPAWFSTVVKQAAAAVPADRLVIGLASYGYDWPAHGAAKPISISAARALAQRTGATMMRDAPEAQPHFTYAVKGVPHQVWFVDGQSNRAEAGLARSLGVKNLGFWRLGTEDPALWDWFARTPQ